MSEQESGQVSEQEKEAIEHFKKYENKLVYEINEKDKKYAKTLLNLIEKLQKEIEKYKRLAKANLKDSQEFQDNMCNHRCIKNNEVLELKAEIEKKDKVIDLMADKLFRHGFFVVEPVKKYDVESELYIKSKTKEEIKEYFYEKAEE